MDGWAFDEMWLSLDAIGYGRGMRGDWRLQEALRLHSERITTWELRALVEEAQKQGSDPAALLRWWLETPYRWREVLGDLSMRVKHEKCYRRTSDEDWLRVRLPRSVSGILKALGVV